MIKLIKHNPYRTLGVLSNTPLRERIANQNKLNAFAKIGKSVIFLYDFDGIIEEVPLRTPENIAAAITAINLDSNQLKHSLFWFINASPIDGIALKYLQSKDIIKAKELFQKRESFSSLINLGVLAFIEGNFAEGYANISKVIHNESYRTDLLETLSLQNITLSENEIAEMFIADLLTEIPATKLLSAVNNPSDKEIISEKAVNEPIAEINTAISAAKSVNSKDANANLTAGTVLMIPEEPAAGPFYARCLVCGLQECRADGRDLARQDHRGQFFPDRRGAFCRRGRRVGQPDGDQQENITDYRIGGLGQTLRIDRLVQSGRDDEFPVGIARRNQLRQLRYDPAAHKRTRRAVFAGTARQPPDPQFAGYP